HQRQPGTAARAQRGRPQRRPAGYRRDRPGDPRTAQHPDLAAADDPAALRQPRRPAAGSSTEQGIPAMIRTLLLPLGLTALLGGCSLLPEAEPVQTYLLPS